LAESFLILSKFLSVCTFIYDSVISIGAVME